MLRFLFLVKSHDDKWKHLKISRIIEVIINRTFICRDCEITFDSAEEMGQIIDGHKPKIEYSFQITDNTISYTFNITNYDGSKETKKIKIDTVSGEIIRACLNFIQQ